MFFQALNHYKPKDNLTIKQLETNFLKDFPHNTSINWFKKEFEYVTGIDIFEYNFNKKNGYKIIYTDDFDIFLFRTDFLDHLEDEIGDFLEIENYKLIKSNLSSNKPYSHLYKEFKKDFYIDKDLANNIYNSKTANYFFTTAEINEFKNNKTQY